MNTKKPLKKAGAIAPIRDTQLGIQSLETGLGLLEAFIGLEPSPMLKTIATRAGMHPAKAHRYLVSFCRAGFVERDGDSGRYRLSHLALRLGLAAMNGLDPVRLGGPLLAQLRDELGHSVVLSVWGRSGVVSVRAENVEAPVALTAKPGSVLALLSTAAGRVFGAWLPRADTSSFLSSELALAAQSRVPELPKNPAGVDMIFAEVRKRGVARVSGLHRPDVNSIAAPVFDHAGRITATISVLGSTRSLNIDWNGEVSQKLRSAAREMSKALGHVE